MECGSFGPVKVRYNLIVCFTESRYAWQCGQRAICFRISLQRAELVFSSRLSQMNRYACLQFTFPPWRSGTGEDGLEEMHAHGEDGISSLRSKV